MDELHHVIQTLTESEITTENQLAEEKERYRIALKSSSDVFFTYRQEEQLIEIVNSRQFNGTWTVEQFRKGVLQSCLTPEEQASFNALYPAMHRRYGHNFCSASRSILTDCG